MGARERGRTTCSADSLRSPLIKDVISGFLSDPCRSVPGMGTASTSAAAEPAGDPTAWTDVVSAIGAGVAALFAVVAVVVAIFAARYAKGQLAGLRDQLDVASKQLEEARLLRREQAQPYVVMSAVPNQTTPEVIEVVIQNLGTTGARDVVISCTPPLVRTDQQGGAEKVALPSATPFLAPGQEWRTFWDHGVERSNDSYDLPDRHDVAITYKDSFGDSHTTPSVLDWSVFVPREWMTEKTVHHAVEQLGKISQELHSLSQPGQVRKVAVYDGPQLDQERAAARAEGKRAREEMVARLRGTQAQQQPAQEEES